MRRTGRKRDLGRVLFAATGLLLITLALPVRADQRVEAVLRKYRATAGKASTLTADVVVTLEQGEAKTTTRARVRLRKPGSVDLILFGPDGRKVQRMLSNGKAQWTVMVGNQQYRRAVGGVSAETLTADGGGYPISAFLYPELLERKLELIYEGAEEREGHLNSVLRMKPKFADRPTGRLYFGPGGMLEAAEIQVDATTKRTLQLRNVRLNVALKPQEFAYAPPAGFRLVQEEDEKYLLAVGQPAPDFRLPQPGGGRLSLADALKDKKAVLVNFWFCA